MKVKECMCNQVWAAKPETTIYDIAKLMETNKIGCVPICDDKNNMVGIITDRDIILRGIACDKDVKTTNARDIMTCNVCTCNKEDDIYDAECKMSQNQVRRIPVIDEELSVYRKLVDGQKIIRFPRYRKDIETPFYIAEDIKYTSYYVVTELFKKMCESNNINIRFDKPEIF